VRNGGRQGLQGWRSDQAVSVIPVGVQTRLNTGFEARLERQESGQLHVCRLHVHQLLRLQNSTFCQQSAFVSMDLAREQGSERHCGYCYRGKQNICHSQAVPACPAEGKQARSKVKRSEVKCCRWTVGSS
jgi:hypothetical protein